MSSIDEVGAAGRVQEHLSAITDAVEGLCDSDLTGLSDDDLTDTIRRLEKALRRASTVGHKLVVETVERSLPGTSRSTSS